MNITDKRFDYIDAAFAEDRSKLRARIDAAFAEESSKFRARQSRRDFTITVAIAFGLIALGFLLILLRFGVH